jgi:hypothetical protein
MDLPVMLCVNLRRVAVVFDGMQGMPVGNFRVVRGFFVVSRLVMFRCLAVVLCRMLVMFCGLRMVLMNIVLTVHLRLPIGGCVWIESIARADETITT